jgi:hypothetical protein
MHTILMLLGCPLSKATNSWKFAIRNFLFAFEYNPTFTNGNLSAIHTHLIISKVVVEFSSSYQF